MKAPLSAAIALVLGPTLADAMPFTVRDQYMSAVGRQEWMINNTRVDWDPKETAIVIVDMWDVHWCHSATTRVGEIAVPMNQTLAAARDAGIHIVFAPSDVTSFYATSAARKRTLSLPNATLPPSTTIKNPGFPLGTSTDGGCDEPAKSGSPWTRQVATLSIDESIDYLIAADLPGNPMAGSQELYNIISKEGLKNLLYMGVHENMCIMERPFAIEHLRGWGWDKHNVAVVRELVDVMYTPKDSPYVSHAEGLAIHTAYIEKFWASSVSMYDILVPSYPHYSGGGGADEEDEL